MTEIGAAADPPAGTVREVDGFAVGHGRGKYFAVSRRCRHLGADLADGTVDEDGCLVCPWHRAAYDVDSGRMTRGPRGFYSKVPGLEPLLKSLTWVLPLRRRRVVLRRGRLFLEADVGGGRRRA
ncbi:Rieske (2Fe-2S) protein [Nocardioides pocheonensis]|jgi:nitrite reductase/ring-hydroxylating ferredoxin subunit|uniref:Rieske (2Fe-2S) protein n=1 Tax=Nocardioides pocheonensis TaxID=661485 RepID=A0A3N0GHS9_9ACTN|nr:Rieske (2Fe-2S) protein [Nocardioides pocheonensis]